MCAASVIYNAGRNTQLLKHTQNITDTTGSVCVCAPCMCVCGGGVFVFSPVCVFAHWYSMGDLFMSVFVKCVFTFS